MRITLGRLAGTACLVFALTQPLYAQEMPQRGASKAAVEQRFGTPIQKHSPVGTPPITRWDYQDYSVYFEGNIALHSVSHSEGVIRRSEPQPAQDSANTQVTHHGTVVELPPIEKTSSRPASDEPEDVPAAPTAETDDTSAEEDWDGSFRFDPATGRIVPASGSDNANAKQSHESSTSSTGAESTSTVNVEEEPTAAQDTTPEASSETTAEDEAEHHQSHGADEPNNEALASEDAEDNSDAEEPVAAEAEESANDNHDEAEEDAGGGFQM